MVDKSFSLPVANLVLLLVAILGFGVYDYTTNQEHQDQLIKIQGEFSKSLEKQNEIIQDVSNNLVKYTDSQTSLLKQEVGTRIANVQDHIDKTKEETQSNLNQLTGKITQVEQKSLSKLSEVEEKIKKINVRSADFSAIIPSIIKSVVSVRVGERLGSGVIVNPKGYVITNFHVVGDAPEVTLIFADGKRAPANLVNSDPSKDLALLKISGEESYNYLTFNPSVEAGEKVIALGSPGGLDFTVTEGIISANNRTGSNGARYIQTDVSINPGNSGGPLVNIAGNIVGISTMKVQQFEGIGFAIHPQEVQAFVLGSNIG